MIFSLTLFHDDLWLSPFAASVFVALKEKGVPFSTHAISLADGEQRLLPFSRESIPARIPTISIRQGDGSEFWLSESIAFSAPPTKSDAGSRFVET